MRRYRLWALAHCLIVALIAATVLIGPSNTSFADYQTELDAYNRAYELYQAEAQAYWNSIAEKRVIRNTKRSNHEEVALSDYILTQPPTYTGPAKPIEPNAPQPPLPPKKYIPVIADFLTDAEEQFNFLPQRPANEIEFKRTYAKAASAAGLTKDQVVRIYAFEVGGNGTYDVQAGLEYKKPDAHAISTALGYNQLLNTNTIELMAEQGDEFVQILQKAAGSLPEKKKKLLNNKIKTLQRMIEFSRTVPDDWGQHEVIANTPKGLAAHAMNLDIDVGPLLQVQVLVSSVRFARSKGYNKTLTAAELEMMNLTGDGNGFDMISMPASFRDSVPTSNFFNQPGYEANSIVIRNNVVAELLTATDAKMDEESKLKGAKDLATVFPK
jgi:hypothetical protein